jgi:hypothetical protein
VVKTGVNALVVGAGARVFFVIAGRAVGEIQIELLANGLRRGIGLDLDDHREVVASWESFVGQENITTLGER